MTDTERAATLRLASRAPRRARSCPEAAISLSKVELIPLQ